jgi:hypothetical protein
VSTFKKYLMIAALVLPLFSVSAFASGNAIAAYVFGGEEMRGENGELLAEGVVNNLVATGRYSNPRRGAREFFRAVDREQARNRGRMLEDRNFCRIGGDEGVQFLVIIDIESAGRGNSVWARLLDLDGCRILGTAEFTGLVRNTNEINAAARDLSNELVHRRMNRRGGGGGAAVGGPTTPPRGRVVRREFTSPGNHSFTFNEGFPATIEVYALGAGGGGQGGHSTIYGNPMNQRTERGTGASGGGGAVAYMRVNVTGPVTFNIGVGRGGNGGSNNHRGLGQGWESGSQGSDGGNTTVSFGSTNLSVEGGKGAGGSGRNLNGGAGGATGRAPSNTGWSTTNGGNGAAGVHQGDQRSANRGGTAGTITGQGPEVSFGGGLGAVSNTAAQAGAGGRGGFDRESGIVGGNGHVLIVITH